MPTGVIINACSVAVGGVLGTLAGRRMSTEWKENMNRIFGLCSMGMGIGSIVLMKNMPAVVFAIIIGTALGLAIRLGDRIQGGAAALQRMLGAVHFGAKAGAGTPAVSGAKAGAGRPTAAGAKPIVGAPALSEAEFAAQFVTVIVLFCASGTGIYGAVLSGMSGDHSVLIAKSILDLFTAMIFACSLGAAVSLISVLQLLILLALFFCAGVIFPMTTPEMIDDFKSCGGFLMVATGFRMLRLTMFPTADMIPAMVLVMPLSWLWSTWILPLVS